MHRFRSRRSLFRLRLGSFLFITLMASTVLLVPAVFYGTMLREETGLVISAVLLGIGLVSGLLYLMIGTGVRCPLCHGPLLGSPGCVRSQKARKLLGSYRLGVASRVLIIGRFRCPCCGEPCKCQTSTHSR